MTELNITLKQLRGMIGQHVRYQGNACQVIEVLESTSELVLLIEQANRKIQPDQHGDAHRRVPTTVTIPVLTMDKTELHPAFLALDLM